MIDSLLVCATAHHSTDICRTIDTCAPPEALIGMPTHRNISSWQIHLISILSLTDRSPFLRSLSLSHQKTDRVTRCAGKLMVWRIIVSLIKPNLHLLLYRSRLTPLLLSCNRIELQVSCERRWKPERNDRRHSRHVTSNLWPPLITFHHGGRSMTSEKCTCYSLSVQNISFSWTIAVPLQRWVSNL